MKFFDINELKFFIRFFISLILIDFLRQVCSSDYRIDLLIQYLEQMTLVIAVLIIYKGHLLELMNARHSKIRSKDRRKENRKSCNINISFSENLQEYKAKIVNISKGGVQLLTTSPPLALNEIDDFFLGTNAIRKKTSTVIWMKKMAHPGF